MPDYVWQPIKPLSEDERKIDLAAMPQIYETWQRSKKRLLELSPTSLEEFNKRLVRRLSIETGILERLYDLDRGTTEVLVTQGFIEDLISRSSTDIEPSRLIDILKDHEAAVHLVMDCVAGNRPLTKGVIHQLHSILTKNEKVTVAVDQFGNRLEIPLLRGKFKELPNNPRRPDGSMHEYCPPVHVESEVDNLLAWLDEYGAEDPIVAAAWLHHRFTQIHPYQDGNGRVARALTAMLLLRSRLLPLVIDRDLRVEYIRSLEQADAGDLAALAQLLARLERAAIMQAVSVDADAELSYQRSIGDQRSLTSAVIDDLARKLDRRRQVKQAELRRVNDVARALRASARRALEQAFARVSGPIAEIAPPEIHMTDGGPDKENAYWYRAEVIRSASESGKFANFTEDHYFVKASIRVARERLVFVTSFHHVGRELSGIMEATAFARLESFEDSEDQEYAAQDFFLCSLEPFVFTFKTPVNEIGDAFARWLDAAFAIALKEYGDRL